MKTRVMLALAQRRLRRCVIDIKNKSRYASYFHEITMHTRALRNTANFYIRNTRSGLSKSPEERTANEIEVLHNVFTGIQKANENAVIRLRKKIRQAECEGGLTGHVMAIKAVEKSKLFSYRKIAGKPTS